jgi:hypothetical protein
MAGEADQWVEVALVVGRGEGTDLLGDLVLGELQPLRVRPAAIPPVQAGDETPGSPSRNVRAGSVLRGRPRLEVLEDHGVEGVEGGGHDRSR